MKRSLGLLLLLLATGAGAVDPRLVADLGVRANAYVAGRVSYDGELPGRLQMLEAQLRGSRNARAAALAEETERLRRLSTRDGVRYGRIGRELQAHLNAVRGLAPSQPQRRPQPRGPAIGNRQLTPEQMRRMWQANRTAGILARNGVFATRTPPNEFWAPSASILVRPGPNGRRTPPPLSRPSLPVLRAPLIELPQGALARGARSQEVANLQSGLNAFRRAAGMRAIAVDGKFGPQTEVAVRDFQLWRRIPPTGVADHNTRSQLRQQYFEVVSRVRRHGAELPQRGDRTPGTLRVQRLINAAAGHRLLEEDGRYGPRTEDAVCAFQRANMLPCTGAVDLRTLEALNDRRIERQSPPRRSRPRRPHPVGGLEEFRPSGRMPQDLAATVYHESRRNGVDPFFYMAMVWAEGGAEAERLERERASRGRPQREARGAAQVTSSAVRADCADLGWQRVITDRQANVACGSRIFRRRLELAGNNDHIVAAAMYNTKAKHWDRIQRQRRVPGFVETTRYVVRIARMYCQNTGRRILDPQRHLSSEMLGVARHTDRVMDSEIATDGQQPRAGCSVFPR